MGKADGRALGDGISQRRADPAASKPTVRGKLRRTNVIRGACADDARRSTSTSWPDPRLVRGGLCDCSLALRVIPRAGRAAGLHLGRPHNGNGAFPAADARRPALDNRIAKAPCCRMILTAIERDPLWVEIRRRIES